jgi:hypothetical protein
MSAKAKLTQAQRDQLVRAIRSQRAGEGPIRARNHGERVTLASLYYRGYLERNAHSGAGTTSPAHEYWPTQQVMEQADRASRERVERMQAEATARGSLATIRVASDA